MGFKLLFILVKWRVPEFTVVWSVFVDFLLLLHMLAWRFPCSLLPGKSNSTLSVMIQMPLIQTHQDSCPFDVPLGEHSRRSPLLLMWNSLGVSVHWGHVLGGQEGEGKENHPLGSGSMREPDLTWKEQRLRGAAKLSRSFTDLVNARLKGRPQRQRDNWCTLSWLGKILPGP